MSVTANAKKTGSTVTERFTKNIPSFSTTTYPELAKKQLFAVVGVADLAIEQVKEVPFDVTAEAKKVQARLTEATKTVPAQVKTLPAQVKTLPAQVKTFGDTVKVKVTEATAKASDGYDKLVVRGEKLVTAIRHQPATETAIAEGRAAVKKAEAASNSAKRAVRASEKAIEDGAAKIG